MVKNPILLVFGAVHVLEEVAWKDPEKDKSLLENLSNVAPNSNESRFSGPPFMQAKKSTHSLRPTSFVFCFVLARWLSFLSRRQRVKCVL